MIAETSIGKAVCGSKIMTLKRYTARAIRKRSMLRGIGDPARVRNARSVMKNGHQKRPSNRPGGCEHIRRDLLDLST